MASRTRLPKGGRRTAVRGCIVAASPPAGLCLLIALVRHRPGTRLPDRDRPYAVVKNLVEGTRSGLGKLCTPLSLRRRGTTPLMDDVDGQPLQRLRTITPGRSCIACARRKIKCDRRQPCGYCRRLQAQCRYPDHEARESQPPDDAILTRLRRIETLLRRLQDSETARELPQQTASPADRFVVDTTAAVYPHSSPGHTILSPGGKLVVGREESRFTSGGFWAELDDENTGEDSDGPTSPATQLADAMIAGCPDAESILFPSIDPGHGSVHLQPPVEQLFSLWQLFIDRVDPLLKILHVPTTQRQIFQASSQMMEDDPGFTALMFAICYAAISSTQNGLASEREATLTRYRHGLQSALVRAEFLSRPTLYSLQALVLFLICARHHTDRTYIWSVTGVATRLATKIGLHQDPSSLGMGPLAAEMRRRLWWQIVILDVLTAEENDMDPAIHEHMFDTKMPSNFNDQDLDSSMTAPPSPSDCRTEMLFALQRVEISYAARKTMFSAKFTADNGYEALSVQQKSEFIDDLQLKLHEKYYRHCDSQIPLCALTTTASSLVLSRMRLTVASSRLSGNPLPAPTNLTTSCMHIVEGIQSLRAHELYEKWTWLFQRYVEWDAIAILLNCLAKSEVPGSEKVWKLVRKFWASWGHRVPPGSIRQRWRRLESLRKKAERANSGEAFRTEISGTESLRMTVPYTLQPSTASAAAPRQAGNIAPTHFISQPSTSATQQMQQPFSWDWELEEGMTNDSNWNIDLDEFHLSGW
ncbi:uncharacterized protein LTR77_006699 [Saxophila tyrrhenica]|uniref:Zn(2)-C6 fungal-type domain-containing protein n=1 Tax=Saxophila tyrrhenica TaxID=1690608 RepID=A0AAV9P9L8_9PEZI|nr:hypothetical protein LTR77_006699 [Saxophila tyrrhenica]